MKISKFVKDFSRKEIFCNIPIFYIIPKEYIFYRQPMKFQNPLYEHEELTYSDVFLFQNYFDGKSRI